MTNHAGLEEVSSANTNAKNTLQARRGSNLGLRRSLLQTDQSTSLSVGVDARPAMRSTFPPVCQSGLCLSLPPITGG